MPFKVDDCLEFGGAEPCTHPTHVRGNGPAIPMVYGSGSTEVCDRCGFWRSTLHTPGPWRPHSELNDALQPDE